MQIANPFKKPDPALEAKLAEANANLASARESYADAALAAEDEASPENIAAREKARKAIERAQAAHADIEAAAAAGAKRKVRQDAEAKAAEIARRWQEAEALAKQHQAQAKKVEKAAAEFANALTELHTLGETFFHTAPVRDQYLSGSLLAHETIDGAAAVELRRCGLKWAAKWWPYSDLTDAPTFSKRMADATADVLHFKGRESRSAK